MEAGSASKKKGSFRFFLNVIRGFDFEGGHDEDKGNTASGELIDVPLHKHEVSLDFTRIETEMEFSFLDNWDFWLRIPYAIKERDAKVGLVEPASKSEQNAMQRHLDLHHKNKTLSGISDLKLLVAHRMTGLIRKGDSLDIALGTSLPTGRAEEDPFKAADENREHEHVQFGTGTFDPLLEFYYTAPITSSLSIGGFATGRFPFYDNNKTYRGPIEITGGQQASYELLKWLHLHANFVIFFQNFAYWDGKRDINTGVIGTSGTVGSAIRFGNANLSLGVRVPFTQKTLSNEGDTFEQGPTILFNVFYSF